MKKKKYYAIKIGNNVKDLMVESWKECSKYVIGYPSLYKSFYNKKEAKRYLENFSNEQVEKCLLINEIERNNRLKEKIQMKYGFEIPNYVLDEIISGRPSNLYCLINLAVINKRLSKKNAEILQEKECIKYIF